MITSFEIQGFKKFDHISFKNLGQLNLFLGNNNSGKTTILEAIFAFTCGENIGAFIRTCLLKGSRISKYYFAEQVLSVVHNQNQLPLKFSFSADFKSEIHKFEHIIEPGDIFSDFKPTIMGSFGSKISDDEGIYDESYEHLARWLVKHNDQGENYVNVSFPLPLGVGKNIVKSRFVDILHHRNQTENIKIYGFLKREQLFEEFVKELSQTFGTIDSLDIIPNPDGSQGSVSVFLKNQSRLPLYSFGDGMQRWYNILGGMIVYKDSIHCIEEIDATLHHEAQAQLARNLVHYSQKYNNQIFMTSHSLEFVDHLLETLYGEQSEVIIPEDRDIVRIITLLDDPETGRTLSRVLTGREAFQSREKYKMELR